MKGELESIVAYIIVSGSGSLVIAMLSTHHGISLYASERLVTGNGWPSVELTKSAVRRVRLYVIAYPYGYISKSGIMVPRF